RARTRQSHRVAIRIPMWGGSAELGLELFHGHRRLQVCRQQRQASRGGPRCWPLREYRLLQGTQEQQVQNDEYNRNDEIPQKHHDHRALFLDKPGFLDQFGLTLKGNILNSELIAPIGIEADGGGNQVPIFLHFLRSTRLLAGLFLAAAACCDLGVIIDNDRNGNLFDLSDGIDHMADGFTHFIIDRFVLLHENGVGAVSRLVRLCRRRARRIVTWSAAQAADTADAFRLRLALLLLLLASNDAVLRIVLFNGLFYLLEVHDDGNLRADFALPHSRFENLNDFSCELRFHSLPRIQLL